MSSLIVLQTRRELCEECDHSSGETGQDGDPLRCSLRYPTACQLRSALSRKEALCPHPDKAQAKMWNEAQVEVLQGCNSRAPLTPEQEAEQEARMREYGQARMAAARQSPAVAQRGSCRGVYRAFPQTAERTKKSS